jgi:hypothetical protein
MHPFPTMKKLTKQQAKEAIRLLDSAAKYLAQRADPASLGVIATARRAVLAHRG